MSGGVISALFNDVFVFSLMIPVGGALLESLLELAYPCSPFVGTIVVITCVVTLFHVAFFFNFDQTFWRALFFDTGYETILQWRDILNYLTLLLSVWMLLDAVQSPSGLKEYNLGEGVVFALLEYCSSIGLPVSSFMNQTQNAVVELAPPVEAKPTCEGYSCWIWGGSSLPTEPTVAGVSPSPSEEIAMQKMVNSGKFFLAVAWTTAFVMKTVYVTTLHTYAKAMQIFTSMQDDSLNDTREEDSAQSMTNYLSDFSVYQKIPKAVQATLDIKSRAEELRRMIKKTDRVNTTS